MSQRERDRLRVISLVLEGKRPQIEAARLLKLSTRQVRRLQRRLEAEGDRGVVHKLRGRPSNHRHAESLRRQAVSIFKREMPDFGALLASEKLHERGLSVAAGTLRDWLRAEGVLQPRRNRDPHRRRRERRPCFGELVQADGSHHDWLEGRGPWMVLVVMIDDATSKTIARFYPAETTQAYMDLLGRYIRKRGRMTALYVDRDSIFRAEKKDVDYVQPTLTQFKRALDDLHIGLILANSPQAKGRVERFNKTAQDRLVKELRLAGARTMEEANSVVEKVFLPWFNRRCTVKPASGNNAHRPLHPSMNLPSILSIHDRRKVTNDYTIRLNNRIYQLLPPPLPGLRGGWVTVEGHLDGSLHLRFKGHQLKFKALGSVRALGALPPDPRSLPHQRTPAVGGNKEGQAAATAQPSAVSPAIGRSGRTPAEPCPAKGVATVPQPQAKRPATKSKWMDNFRFAKRSRKTGHSYPPQTADISIRA